MKNTPDVKYIATRRSIMTMLQGTGQPVGDRAEEAYTKTQIDGGKHCTDGIEVIQWSDIHAERQQDDAEDQAHPERGQHLHSAPRHDHVKRLDDGKNSSGLP